MQLSIVSVPVALIYCFTGKSESQAWYLNGYAQGTTFRIVYYAGDSLVSRNEVEQIFSEVDSSLSIYKPYSLISQFNRSPTGVLADKHLKLVVNKSLDVYRETGGAFDITVYPLVRAWGFGTKKVSVLPTADSIRAIMPCVGSGNLSLRNDHILKRIPGLQIDVNGIAQGYTVDVLAALLEKKGVESYMVELGGEIRVKGLKPDKQRMKIGIEGPAKTASSEPVIQKIIEIEEGAVTTSGSYRKYVTNGNKKISHLIDPKTGNSFENELISVTVVAKDAITADAYDNALMGMGLGKALSFASSHPDLEAYFIYYKSDGTVADTSTKGFRKLIALQP